MSAKASHDDLLELGAISDVEEHEELGLQSISDKSECTDGAGCVTQVLRRYSCGEERIWATVLSVMIASLPALLFGCTLGFPSPVLLDLMELDQQEYRFDTLLSDLFSVSTICILCSSTVEHQLCTA